jgi:hypothetical protein
MRALTLSIAAGLLLCAARSAVATDRPFGDEVRAVAHCRSLFGAPVGHDPLLFEVNQYYALEVVLDDHDAVRALNVVPKHWFSEAHPEWEGLDDYTQLTGPESDAMVARLDEIWPKGRLVKQDNFAIVTNCTAPIRTVYEHAEVVTGEVVDLRRGDDAPRAIRYVEIAYTDAVP